MDDKHCQDISKQTKQENHAVKYRQQNSCCIVVVVEVTRVVAGIVVSVHLDAGQIWKTNIKLINYNFKGYMDHWLHFWGGEIGYTTDFFFIFKALL